MASVIRSSHLFRLSSQVLKEFSLVRNVHNFPTKNYIVYNCLLCRKFHCSNYLLKKKKSDVEKATESEGRRVLRYTSKMKSNNALIDVWRNITVRELAKLMERDTDQVYESMIYVEDSSSYDKDSSMIDNPKVIKDILKICGFRYRFVSPPDKSHNDLELDKDVIRQSPAPLEMLRPRPPVVTVMGHVDHGKTTLLDSLRHTSVVDMEFGGITQHIGAFSVKVQSGELVTFLDTPGHAAFSAMRARGANVTDMVVLVVAADDGVMEQTVESIRMAREANVPLIVAINKIDKPAADIAATKQLLAQQGVLVEDLGGDVQSVPISALKGTNLEMLVEAISMQAQLMDLKADPTGLVEGVVIESSKDPKRGKLATVIVQRGTLRKGSILVAGLGWARARTMFSSEGQPVNEAPPSTPVQLLGWRELPTAGDDMLEVPSEKRANEVIRWRNNRKMEEKQKSDYEVIASKEAEHHAEYKAVLEQKRLRGRFKTRPDGPRQKMFTESNEPTLNIVIKGDVWGTMEAILDVLETYEDHSRCKLDIVHYGLGAVSENDIDMAEMFKAVLYTFNVNCPMQLVSVLKAKNITIKSHNIIYKMIDDIKSEINLRIPACQEESLLGEANVLQAFSVNEGRKKSFVAGCRCTRGTLKKNGLYRLIRGQDNLYEGKLESMRHLKNEVDTIKKDVECGLKLVDGNLEVKPGDQIICYEMVDVKHNTDWNPGF